MSLVLALMAVLVLGWAAVSDVRSLTIPNSLVIALAALALVNALIAGSLDALGWVGCLGCLIIGIILWKAKIIGAGDVKLAAAALLWLPGQVIDFLFLTAILGGLVSLVYLVKGRIVKKKAKQIPYGLPLSIATVALMALARF
ncbi:MAG: prepilin peptidase [Deltaproteobacteria bacterium]|jgi:prepilin peptidase CpaA|nr:prepilin peptidase [Deltaproteobacteria bacterium]